MGQVCRRKGTLSKNKKFHKKRATCNFTKDIDQVYEDVKPENAGKFMNQQFDESLPGFGQYYCISCAKHYVT